jgi:hypothetical protein
VDVKRNQLLRHKECIKPAVVLVKSIYVEEEADRRDKEEENFLNRFEEIEENIQIWFFFNFICFVYFMLYIYIFFFLNI